MARSTFWVSVLLLLGAVVGCTPAPSTSGTTGSPFTTPASPSSARASPAGPGGSVAASAPNGLVDIGGRRLDIECSGSGEPVVVLDAGLGNTSAVWSSVVSKVQDFATVCAYDRAGLGRSDVRPLPHGAASAVDDLHALLKAAGLPAPYVLVGASFGGLDAQLFARRYPTETAGVVLVDSLAPEWDRRLEAILTPAQVAARRAIPNGEDMSNEDIRASEDAIPAAPPFPTVPLVVLRHGLPFPGGPDWPTAKVEALWAELQDGLAQLSPRSAELVASQSHHRIHQDQPDLVAAAIHAVVDPARWPPSAPAEQPAFGAGAPVVPPGSIPGRLVFAGAEGIQSATPDGTQIRTIVPSRGMMLGAPSIDAAGRHVAYMRSARSPASSGPQSTTPSEIWIADAKTGISRRLAPDGQLPAISPDGTLIAFAHQDRTFVIRSDGTGLRDLGEGGCAVWSPDGTRLATCTADGHVELVRVADGSRATLATGPASNEPTQIEEPTAWSPDGKTLAVFSTRDGNGEIYLIGADGTDERRLTTAPGNQFADAWTSAGLLVTSSLPDAEVSDWFLVDPITGDPRVIPWMRGVPDPIAYAEGANR